MNSFEFIPVLTRGRGSYVGTDGKQNEILKISVLSENEWFSRESVSDRWVN